ncbi:type II secretion system protein GspH [Aliikangiella marina]|uniref:Type II secretion system protein H n=1 Tax=Aliikangiella marina TaxID=1712262 RepID=A0A545T9N5_9GAMM|nr:type II secretion system minor pseudopilin GspH [Aliikangiella marina]TQV73922.1 type II secretion system protein GspH [Aliikangiella marina]
MATQFVRPVKFAINRGFSLIEILVAMAIIALLAGLAIPFMGNSNDKYARQEINRLLAAVELVRDMAVIQNREYGLTIDEDGYQFLILDDEDPEAPPRWKIISDVKALNQYEFPEEVEVNVAIDGENIFDSAEDDVEIFEEDVNIFEDEEEEEQVDPPQIYFLSTGEQNQFTLAVASNDQFQSDREEPKFYRIKGELSGVLEYQGPLPGNLFQDIDRDYTDYLEDDS